MFRARFLFFLPSTAGFNSVDDETWDDGASDELLMALCGLFSGDDDDDGVYFFSVDGTFFKVDVLCALFRCGISWLVSIKTSTLPLSICDGSGSMYVEAQEL